MNTTERCDDLDSAVVFVDDWEAGGQPMSEAQASYIAALAQQAHEPAAVEDGLTRAEAAQRIEALRHKIGLDQDRP